MTSRTTPHRLAVRGRRIIAATITLIVGAAVLPSNAAPDSDSRLAGEQRGVHLTARLPGASDLPAPGTISLAEGTVTGSQGTVVRGSRMYITVGPENPIWGALYFAEFNWPVEDPTQFVALCSQGRPCVPDPFYQPECATDEPATRKMSYYFRNPLYPLSPLGGGGADVGLLAETRVNLLAFGSIPATATLTMRTPSSGGSVRPLMAHIWQRGTGYPIGCGPLQVAAPPISALVEGKVEIRLSDLTVDGVSVDLGPNCRTETPVDLYLWGETDRRGYYPNSGGDLGAYDGLHPGSVIPLDDPFYFGHFEGRDLPASSGVHVPPFTGCGIGSDDLSPVISAMASGPNNPVRAVQGQTASFDSIPLEDLTQCSPFGGCPLPAPAVPPMPPLPSGE